MTLRKWSDAVGRDIYPTYGRDASVMVFVALADHDAVLNLDDYVVLSLTATQAYLAPRADRHTVTLTEGP